MPFYDFITPAIIVAIYLLIYIFRKKISKHIELFQRNHHLANFYISGFVETCQIKLNSVKKSILIPVLSITIMNVIVYSTLVISNPSFSITEKLASVSIVPIAEEIIFRGFFLGFFFIYAPKIALKNKNHNKMVKLSIISSGIMLTSGLFAFSHPQPAPLQFISSLIYSILYLYDNRNLTGPITAHFVNNLIANFFF